MHQLLEKTLSLSNEITQLSKQKNWEKVFELTRLRQEHLEEYFEISPLPDLPETIQKVKEKIELSDSKSKAMMSVDKQSLLKESINLNDTRKAISQYHKVQSG